MLMRAKPRFIMMAFSIMSVLLLALSACGASGTPTTPTTSGGQPKAGGTWIDDLYEEPDSFIPNGVSETFADLVDQTLYTPLFYGDAQGNVHPGLASEIPTQANGDVSADLKTWTFKLRPNLVWSDGQPINADDVDFTWRLWDNPKFGAYSTTGFNLITSDTISADKLSITFHLSSPFEPFVSIWTDGLAAVMPKHHFASMDPGSILKSPDNLKPTVVSGPFMMTESVIHDHYTVVKNPKYYLASQGLPYLDKIVFRIVTNQDTILKDIQSGSIDSSWFLDVTKIPQYKAISTYSLVQSSVSAGFEAIYFDLHNPLLQDVNLRKAIAMAIDHNALIQTARRGAAAPLCTDHPSGVKPGYQANAPCPSFDPAAAKQLLLSNGYTMGSDGVMVKNGHRMEFQYSTTADNAWRAADELILQSNLKAIGVKIDIQNYPASTFFGTLLPHGQPGKYDLGEFENTFAYDADDSPNFSCAQVPSAANNYGGGNFSFYCNHTLDNLFNQELATTDPTKRQAVFDQIHQIYLTDFPFVTLYEPHDVAMAKNVVHNYAPGPEGASETVNVWEWWCTNGTC